MRRLIVAALLLRTAAGAYAAVPVLERVEVIAEPALAVRLSLSASASFRARTLAADGDLPHRIYIDLDGATLGPETPSVVPGTGAVVRVRTGRFQPTVVRVVLDLIEPTPFRVRADGQTVVEVELGGADPEPAAKGPPAPPAVSAAPAPPPPASAAPPPPSARASAAPRPAPRALAAPAPAPPSVPAADLPLVVLDAGHGGRDPGAEGVGGVREKDVVLALARVVAARLEARLPVRVLMTRTDDSFLPLAQRLDVPVDGTALFLSLHANACPEDPGTRGVEIFYGGGGLRPTGATTPPASRRAALLGRCLAEALDARLGTVRGLARPAAFRVLSQNPVPSALVEVGYLTHPGDAARAQSAGYQMLVADALVDGVARFLRASSPPL